MEKKVIPPSTDAPSSPQITFHFRQLREHGQSRPAAIEFLTKAIQSGDAIPKPELPDGWRLEADGDELFVVWPGGRRNTREFSLYKPRYQTAPPDVFKPVPPPPGLMDKLYPPGYEPPKLSRAAQQSPRRTLSGLERWRADNPLLTPSQPIDPALTAALTKIADALKPPDKPEASRKDGRRPRAAAQREKRPPQVVGEAIIADLCAEKDYGKRIPKKVKTQTVWGVMKKRWDAKCVELEFSPKDVLVPKTWQTVHAWLGRKKR